MNRRFLSLCVISLSLISSISFASSTNYQMAYNNCMTHALSDEPQDFFLKFIRMKPDKQAKYCIDFLKKNHPDMAQELDLDIFKQGFFDGRYRKE